MEKGTAGWTVVWRKTDTCAHYDGSYFFVVFIFVIRRRTTWRGLFVARCALSTGHDRNYPTGRCLKVACTDGCNRGECRTRP
ncbi:hypothetical protein BN844_0835 [Pseudomonas sp. SHC52]|nr:hypothetical protein BN844_0835 [Pseudomonas sp. SHC52]